ncbi:uncharacterized protein LOC111318887 [Stylophora pistillata]|uniref:Uncharacterized protein n=1 Tax=Stylophora pistillata TaxID=50429 RepID=A0A2B4R4H6_STYPI|nr:uncharacterized protein LOC111318887 [Stylophora pistillata]PFX12056.1 hypothetical protein AWC38_SpisGene24045 [Stylophora pistillata]
MKMLLTQLVCFIAGLVFLQSISVDAKTDEVLEMKLFNPKFRASDKELYEMLKAANLPGRGYKKEVVTKVVEGESGKQEYQKIHFYYKDVSCGPKLLKVEEELRRLFPAIVGKEVNKNFKMEVKSRHLTNMRECKVGLEVHFMKNQGCSDSGHKSVPKRRKERGFLDCWFCKGCIAVSAR